MRPDKAGWPTRQASLMGAWLGPMQPVGTTLPPGNLEPCRTAVLDPDTAPEAQQPNQAASQGRGLKGGYTVDVCEQQAELRPFRRSSLPEAVTPRLSLTASWPAVAGLDVVTPASSGPAEALVTRDGSVAAGAEA